MTVGLGRREKDKCQFAHFFQNQTVLGETSASSISREGTSTFWPILMLHFGNTCFIHLNFELQWSFSKFYIWFWGSPHAFCLWVNNHFKSEYYSVIMLYCFSDLFNVISVYHLSIILFLDIVHQICNMKSVFVYIPFVEWKLIQRTNILITTWIAVHIIWKFFLVQNSLILKGYRL